mmetsp:Transcript_3201/g.4886  ORF Transcript_3201/g.4886 Transcript_3201/m.4886 type:complete len:102 (+) Transcript_3201:138-443(+)
MAFDEKKRLMNIPIFFGFHEDDFIEPYMCALDTSLPTIIIPNNKCEECEGKKYKPGSDVQSPSIDFFHKMIYWRFSQGSFKVREETDMMILGYNPDIAKDD